MATANTFASILIAVDRWVAFLAEFTRENSGAHAHLQVLGNDLGRIVEAENRPFEGISADVRDGEHAVWITFSSASTDHLAGGVQNVTAIWLQPPIGRIGASVLIVARDGSRTLLELSRPEEYALPPAAPRGIFS